MEKIERVLKTTLRSLRWRNYRLYFLGQVVSVSGTWMQTFAQGWLVLDLSHNDAIALGTIVSLQFLPILLFGTFGGLIADRMDKRKILFITQGSSALLSVSLAVLVQLGAINVLGVAILAFLTGCINVFDNPARQSFVFEMVGADDLSNAIGLNSVIMNLARVLGPGIGGFIIALGSLYLCFYINALSFLAVIGALYLMDPAQLRKSPFLRKESGQVRQGLTYVLHSPELRNPMLAIFSVGLMAYNFQVTLLLLARNTFFLDSSRAGLLFSLMGAGAVLGGLVVAYRGKPTYTQFEAVILVFGILLSILAFVPTFFLAEFEVVLLGAFSIAFIALTNSLIQMSADPDKRGRVMSIYTIGFLGTTPIGSLTVSLIARVSNPRIAILAGGIVTIGTGLVTYFSLNRSGLINLRFFRKPQNSLGNDVSLNLRSSSPNRLGS